MPNTSTQFQQSKARLHQVLAQALAQPLHEPSPTQPAQRVLPATARSYGGNLGTYKPLVLTWEKPSYA